RRALAPPRRPPPVPYTTLFRSLTGRIEPSANKNAVLPVLCATLLSDAPITLRNVPEITDVLRIVDFFGELGSTVQWDKQAKVLEDRKSTRLNSSHVKISYAVFC